MNEQEILANWQRKGWRVTARRAQTVQNSLTGLPEPTGNLIWGISGPNDEYDEVVVRETAPARPAVPSPGSTDPSQPATAAQYEPVQGPKENPTKPTTTSDRPNYRSTVINGVTYESWDGHPWAPSSELPVSTSGSTTKTPSSPDKWQPIKDDTGRTIAMLDPVTGERQSAPAASPADKTTPAGATKDTFEGSRQITWVADGNGNWSIKTIGQPLSDATKPKEGDTRPNVSSGYEIREVYRGGQWVTDPTFTPRPYSPDLATKPKEGATRSNVVQGQQIQQVYRGGDWVTDPSVQPTPFGRQTDLNAEVQRLQGLAQAERDRIAALPLDPAEKQRQWQQWWQATIEPRKQALQAEQQQTRYPLEVQAAQAARQERQDALSYEKQRQDTARQAATDAVSRVTATLPYRVGPSFGAEFSQALKTLSGGGGQVSFSPGAFTYAMPDLNQIAEQATAKALAGISPYAAGLAGLPAPSLPPAVDIAGLLNQSNYTFPTGTLGAPAPPAAVPPVAPTPDQFGLTMPRYRGPVFG